MSTSEDCELFQLTNCRLVRGHTLIADDLWVRAGKIVDPQQVFYVEKKRADRQLDCGGKIIAPGYIDLQVNGGFGIDFTDNRVKVEDGINFVAKRLLRFGVTSFCPTLVTSAPETYKLILPRVPKHTAGGAGILGMHLEGPFINPLKRGAHAEQHIKPPSIETILATYGPLDNVKIITLAPELLADVSVIAQLKALGIAVSLGHSMADLHTSEQAALQGARLITHLFNAMPQFHHRDPGLVGLLASNALPAGETIYFGVIADDVHTHPAALRIAQRTNSRGLILVTDAISALGLEAGAHRIGGLSLEVRDGKAFIVNTNTLCGSIASMDKCVRNFRAATDCTTAYAIEAATLHPAQLLNMDKQKGSLAFGADADFILLDDDLNVHSTWIAGQLVYDASQESSSEA